MVQFPTSWFQSNDTHPAAIMNTNSILRSARAHPIWREVFCLALLVGLGFAVDVQKTGKPSAPTSRTPLPAGSKGEVAVEDEWTARITPLLEEDDMELRHLRLAELGREMGLSDPQRGWQLHLEIFDFLPDKQVFGMSLLRAWGRKGPQGALAACQNIPEGESRASAYAEALEGWTREAPKSAGDWAVQNLFGSYRRAAIARIGKVWARTEPLVAAKWALGHSNESDKIFALTEVIETWAGNHARDAAEWAVKLPKGNLRDLSLSEAVLKWADDAHRPAAEWLMSHPENIWLLPRAVARWGRQDPVAAAAWLKQVQDESLVREAKLAIVSEWAGYNPKAALDWAQANLTGDERETALGQVMEIWGSDYPLEALAWTRKIKAENERSIMLESLFETWCRTDLDNAKLWVKQQPAGLEKDLGTEQVASMLAASDPPAALDMLLSLQNKARLQQSLTQHFQDWKEREATAA